MQSKCTIWIPKYLEEAGEAGGMDVSQMVYLVHVKVDQFCPALCDPTHWCPLGSSVHAILQERILEWV